MTLECRGTVVLRGFGIVPGDALAMFIQMAEEKFRAGIPLGRGRTEPLEAGLVVLIRGVPQIRLRDLVLSKGVAVLGLRLQLGKRRAGILRRLWYSATALSGCKHGGEKQQRNEKRVRVTQA